VVSAYCSAGKLDEAPISGKVTVGCTPWESWLHTTQWCGGTPLDFFDVTTMVARTKLRKEIKQEQAVGEATLPSPRRQPHRQGSWQWNGSGWESNRSIPLWRYRQWGFWSNKYPTKYHASPGNFAQALKYQPFPRIFR
jgi:hypothetical protein